MEAIAGLTKHDPYLTKSRSERMIERRQRRIRFAEHSVPDHPIRILSATERSGAARGLQGSFKRQVEADAAADCLQRWEAIESQVRAFSLPSAGNSRDEAPLDRMPRILDIQKIVCRARSIDLIEMGADRRTAAPVMARQIAMYLAKRLTHRSTTFIGQHFGNRDHTTVLHAINKIEKLVRNDARFAAEIDALIREIAKVRT
jgi:Bacterial dnaA protein helix-turn-helix